MAAKVSKDQDETERRKKLCEDRTPAQLGNIGSLSDIPIPAPIQNIFSSKGVAPSKPKTKNTMEMAEKRK